MVQSSLGPLAQEKKKDKNTTLFQYVFKSCLQMQLSDLPFCLHLTQRSRDKNELEASPSIIVDLKPPVIIILYRLFLQLAYTQGF